MFSALCSSSNVTEAVVTLLHICYRTGEKCHQDCLNVRGWRGDAQGGNI